MYDTGVGNVSRSPQISVSTLHAPSNSSPIAYTAAMLCTRDLLQSAICTSRLCVDRLCSVSVLKTEYTWHQISSVFAPRTSNRSLCSSPLFAPLDECDTRRLGSAITAVVFRAPLSRTRVIDRQVPACLWRVPVVTAGYPLPGSGNASDLWRVPICGGYPERCCSTPGTLTGEAEKLHVLARLLIFSRNFNTGVCVAGVVDLYGICCTKWDQGARWTCGG